MSFAVGPGLHRYIGPNGLPRPGLRTRSAIVQLSPTRATLSIPDLRAAVRGYVIAPDDPEYDAARTVFVGGVDRHPAVIVRVADAGDVAHVLSVARDTGLELAIRSGGHGNGGQGVCEGGIVLDVHDLRALDIDVEGRTAWAGAGLTAGEYSATVGAHGLATGFGDTGSVGLGGITLGGGVGYLARKFGLTVDALIGAEIVTADGEVRHVDADHEPDLFWAIRGGGGNFGVVTRFHYRLDEVPSIVGGMLLLPASAEVIAGFVAAADAAPDELSTIANVMPCPPMPFVPEEWHGKLSIMALLCYAGDAEAGQRAIAPFRALATPIADMVRPMPYPEIYPPESDDYHPRAAVRTLFLDKVDRAVADDIIARLQSAPGQMAVAQLRILGGAMARVPADATAFAHRKSRIMANFASLYERDDEKSKSEAWVAAFADDLRQGDTGAYVNFLGDEGEARIHAAYPGATWDRLADLKQRYDPTNLFRLNQNIPPSGRDPG
jgi:FAD/FMN-containing dehydrogenase